MKEPKDFYKEYYNEQWQPKDEADKFKKQFDYFDLLDFARSYAEAITVTHCCKSDSELLKCEHKYGQLKDGIYTCFDCGHKEEW